jgi:hypothetical protein
MPRLKRRAPAARSARTPWHTRACVRQAVALRVDYATAQGQVGLGLVRNLSLQGMYLESASGHGTPEMTPGDLLTVAFVLPSGVPVSCGRWSSIAIATGMACSFARDICNRSPISRTIGPR